MFGLGKNKIEDTRTDKETYLKVREIVARMPRDKLRQQALLLMENQTNPTVKVTKDIEIETYLLDYIVANELQKSRGED